MSKHSDSDQSLKFPNGCSVKRAKQRAKMLADETDVPLHEALDQIAKQNGVPLPWAKALEQLRAGAPGPGRQGFSFSLPGTSGSQVIAAFTPERKVAYVIASEGAGRMIASFAIAAAANIMGLRVHSIELTPAREWPVGRDMQSTAALTERLVTELLGAELEHRFPRTFSRTKIDEVEGGLDSRVIAELMMQQKTDMVIFNDGALLRAEHRVSLQEVTALVEAFPSYVVLALDPSDPSAKEAMANIQRPDGAPAPIAFSLLENKRTVLPYSFDLAGNLYDGVKLQVTIPPNFRWRFRDDLDEDLERADIQAPTPF